MKFFIVCALLVVSALAAPQVPTTPVPIVHQELEVHQDGSFVNKWVWKSMCDCKLWKNN